MLYLKNDINNLCDYIQAIEKVQEMKKTQEGTAFQWYRGHADKDWELIPKVQRGFHGEDEALFRKERSYTNDYQARASQLRCITPPLDNYSGWLTLMQHYGLPARLLDWSRSPLIALYFAVSDMSASEKDVCIWILTPGLLNTSQSLEQPSMIDGKEYDNTFIYSTQTD